MDAHTDIFYRIKSILILFEKFTAGISLLLLLILSLSQVILRNFFELGFSDIDVISRHLVLFVTFMGAALVSESNQHIKIDCINEFIKPTFKQQLKRPLFLISSIICGIFFWYALQFWLDELRYAPANEQLALILSLIIPVGFFTLSLHFLLLTLSHHSAETN